MRSLTCSKKGQTTIQGLPTAIIALVFAAVILVMGLVITQALQDTTDGDETSGATSNESITLAGTGITSEISDSDSCGYTTWSPSIVYNGSTNETLTVTTDYTVNANGSLMNVTHLVTPLLVTHTYSWGGQACEGANLTVVGLGTFADFWEIIVLAIVITVVIGLLLVVFGGGRRER